ncbi:MAG: hypothetical protein J4432_03930 [DPANN group archaeon]|nr:hypothetical protein [DPANN group archaeon]
MTAWQTTSGDVCSKCNAPVAYKCQMCSAFMIEKDEEHPCGNENIMPVCRGCQQVEAECACET